jgi:hypothetical protein
MKRFMKRFLFLALVALFAAACLGLLATSALAYQAPLTNAPTTAYIQLEDGSVWWDISGTTHDGAIPAGWDVVLWSGWYAPTRGQVQEAPNSWLIVCQVSGPGLDLVVSPADSLQRWSTMYSFPGSAFNKANATIWGRDWYVDLGRSLHGSYGGVVTETLRHTVNDLSFYGDVWSRHAQQKPVKISAGTTDFPLSFSVQ